jgi:uncharacterized protein (TIGR00369 family)
VDDRLTQLQNAGGEFLPGLLGIEFDGYEEGLVRSKLTLRKEHFAPHGYVHAATVVALADTSAGYGCLLTLPEGATGFTTIELKTNFLRSAREGTITCEARLVHGGRTTQVWDATVGDPEGRAMALFRCTQMILRPSS